MRKEDFFEVLGELDDDMVKGVKFRMKASKAKSPAWVKLGVVAACLCLIVGGTAVWLWQNFLITPGDISTPGIGDEGGIVEGGGGMYSVAVYPATESEENVYSADVTSLAEDEALNNALAEHLPRRLPEGFHYGRGSIYSTIMKDGTRYNMLRVEYISGIIPEQQFTEDGGAIAPNPETTGEVFIVCVMDYEPETNINIYSSGEEVTVAILEENGSAYIRHGNCCIGVFTETADPAIVLEALRNIE